MYVKEVWGSWPWADFFESFFKSCGGEQKAKILTKVAVVTAKSYASSSGSGIRRRLIVWLCSEVNTGKFHTLIFMLRSGPVCCFFGHAFYGRIAAKANLRVSKFWQKFPKSCDEMSKSKKVKLWSLQKKVCSGPNCCGAFSQYNIYNTY